MIYLIDGASRSGKTSLALRLLEQRSIPYLSIDTLIMGLRGAGYREYSDGRDDIDIAKHLVKILSPMIENILYCGVPYALEGVHMRPAFIRKMIKMAPQSVAGCVLGYPDLSLNQKLADMHKYPSLANDWLSAKKPEQQRRHLTRHLEISVIDRSEAKIANVAYFNTGINFDESLDEALDYLIGQATGST